MPLKQASALAGYVIATDLLRGKKGKRRLKRRQQYKRRVKMINKFEILETGQRMHVLFLLYNAACTK